MNKWWGYRHANGNLQVKRYFDERDIEDAVDSDFCVSIIYPFDATDRDEALKIAYLKMGGTRNE